MDDKFIIRSDNDYDKFDGYVDMICNNLVKKLRSSHDYIVRNKGLIGKLVTIRNRGVSKPFNIPFVKILGFTLYKDNGEFSIEYLNLVSDFPDIYYFGKDMIYDSNLESITIINNEKETALFNITIEIMNSNCNDVSNINNLIIEAKDIVDNFGNISNDRQYPIKCAINFIDNLYSLVDTSRILLTNKYKVVRITDNDNYGNIYNRDMIKINDISYDIRIKGLYLSYSYLKKEGNTITLVDFGERISYNNATYQIEPVSEDSDEYKEFINIYNILKSRTNLKKGSNKNE